MSQASFGDVSVSQTLEEIAGQMRLATEQARREGEAQGTRRWTERTNQAGRRMRLAADPNAWGQVLAEAAGAACVAVFRQQGDAYRLVGLEGTSSDQVASALREKGIAKTALAPALQNALETPDTVVALRTASEVSNELVELFPQCEATKSHIFPLVSRQKATGFLYLLAETPIDVNAMELLTTLAEASWLERPAPPVTPLLSIVAAAPPPVTPLPKAKDAWEQLTPAQRDLHLRAQNFARATVSRLLLRHHDAVRTGREMGNLYMAFQKPLDSDRRLYRERFLEGQPSMVDYLHVELVRILAEGNEPLLGPEYPGPLG